MLCSGYVCLELRHRIMNFSSQIRRQTKKGGFELPEFLVPDCFRAQVGQKALKASNAPERKRRNPQTLAG